MIPKRTFSLLTALLLTAAAGCDFDVSQPGAVDVAVLRVQVTGGFADANFTYEVSSVGHVTGVDCTAGCEYAAGDTLQRLSPAQRQAFVELVNRSGLPTAGRPVDFGTNCCDQLTFRVTYTSGLEIRTFQGSMQTFPVALRDLVSTVHGLYQGTLPVIMNQTGGLEGFPTAPVTVDSAWVEGTETLVVDVTYGGGCSEHDLEAVAWTGWMESDPVKLGVALAHDDHDDPCDALVQATLRFGLASVRRAYILAYSAQPTTVILQVGGANSGTVIEVPLII